MGAHQLRKRVARCVGLGMGALVFGLAFGQSLSAASTPPVGTVWSVNKQQDPGADGELNVTLSVKLDALTDTQITFRYTFFGEIGFITSQPCNNPTAIPLPFNRVAFTISWSSSSNPGQPSPLVGESLLSTKLDYLAPSFVNCWGPLANPPAFYSNAVSYVRYQGLKFSMTATVPRSPYFSEGVGHSVTFSATSNANPDGVNFLGGSVPVPSISGAPTSATTTTVKKSTTTTLAAGEATTTTVDDESTTTVVTDTTEPVRNATFDPVVGPQGGSVADVAYNLATETPDQEKERKENTAESVAITAAVLVSSLAAVVPAVGAVGAVGVAGGVVGAATARAFSGGDLLPQVPRSGAPNAPRRVFPGRRFPERPQPEKPERPNPESSGPIDLENPFDAPQNFSADEVATDVAPAEGVDVLFVRVITALQFVSRFPFLRSGLRRIAEVAVVSPALAASLPAAVLVVSVLAAVLAHLGTLGAVGAVVVLFAVSFVAPVLSVVSVVGWLVGRVVMSPQDFLAATGESIALLPGLLIIPMMVRGIIGPAGRSRPWERRASLVLAPVLATLAFKGWVVNLNDSVGSLVSLAPDSLGWSTARLLDVPSARDGWVLSVVFTVLVMVVAVAAVRCAEDSGQPVFVVGRWMHDDNPLQSRRRHHISQTTLKSAVPRAWLRPVAYALATTVMALVLAPILGWQAFVLIGAFLLGVAGLRRTPRKFSAEVHPIVKKVPMVMLGIVLGGVAVSPGRALVAFGVIALIAIASTPIRVRQLWQ